jgi:hypothetical protein
MLPAPKQRRLFVVNSFPFDRFHKDVQYYRDTMLALLRYLVPREDRDQWDMDVDMVRSSEVSDNAEINKAVMQRDAYNCGIYVCTNALCVAFGYDLKCFKPREIDQFRKQRMIAEMRNGGFNGLYNYDMFELPQGPGENPSQWNYRKLLAAHRLRNGERLPEGLDDSPKGSEGSSSATESSGDPEDTPQGSNEDGNEDNDEARGLGNIDIDVANLLTEKMAPRPIFPTASQCLWIDNDLGIPRLESIERPVDPQYNARYGVLYPFYHVDFNEAVKCSKEEMIEACKNFPIANWERWCDLEKDFFLDWMMTEMGATMSRIHKDPTPPFPGLGDGYEIWLKWKAEGKKPRSIKEVAPETSKQAEQDNKIPEIKKTDNIPARTRTSPRTAKAKDEKKMTSPMRTSPRLLSQKIRLVENTSEEEQVVTEVVTVMSAMRERPHKRVRTRKLKSLDDDSSK